MKICGFEKFSMVDWDGKVVCTVFCAGCNFRCPFCHNRSLALSSAPGIPESEVFDYLEKRKGLIDGVCVSGGEPTLSHDLKDFIAKIKALGYKVKLDTNGTNPEVVKDLLDNGLVDYVAMDVKDSPEKYPLITKTKNLDLNKVLETMSILKSSGVDFEFRTTLIKEFHTEEDMKRIALLVKGAKRYFLQKYVDNDNCIEHGFTAVDRDTAEKWLSLFDGVDKASLRGY
ncbi:MAG: anaerobic ribonucleoside-triphosphate reductase activating protein [Clostridia bacterium]|nr:anaerobic ribonucleoside-triphosphate reductase activating protein [Clostridia bacterium]